MCYNSLAVPVGTERKPKTQVAVINRYKVGSLLYYNWERKDKSTIKAITEIRTSSPVCWSLSLSCQATPMSPLCNLSNCALLLLLMHSANESILSLAALRGDHSSWLDRTLLVVYASYQFRLAEISEIINPAADALLIKLVQVVLWKHHVVLC